MIAPDNTHVNREGVIKMENNKLTMAIVAAALVGAGVYLGIIDISFLTNLLGK